VDQRIRLWIGADDAPDIAAAVRQYGPYIAAETLASDLRTDPPPPDAVTADCRVAGRQPLVAGWSLSSSPRSPRWLGRRATAMAARRA
jgi:hypothetical protein